MMIKLCIECKYHVYLNYTELNACNHPKICKISLVDGKRGPAILCEHLRAVDSYRCGVKGTYWEKKE